MSVAIRETDGTEGRLKSKKKTARINYIPFYLMMLPGIAYLIANNYIPMFGILIAFKKLDYTKGILGSDWYGLNNFEYLFKTKDAFIMIRNTLGYNLIFITLGLVTALSIAIMMTEIGKKKIAKFIQPAICFPNMVSIIIVAYLVYAFLGSNGFINNTILHGNGVKWYNEAKYWPFILVIVNFWKSAGYSSIIYIASISGIDASLYEAAKLDGATKMQQVFKITLPIIKPMIVLMLLLSVSKIFNSDFGLFLQVPMNSGMLFSTTQTIDTYVYRSLMELHNVGMSSAASVFQSVIGFILVMVSNAFVRKIDSESALF
jgi:putative aldouronate transport system permease protein